ncbi:MAG: hypothetical protein K0U72_18245 [Gammaproteobacteria bacterium]|nr:hypothetical protein [Gammaproteobacteria bacterium]
MINKSLALTLVALTLTQAVGATELDVSLPDSSWLELDQQMAMRAIRKTEFDLLVLPTQGGENSFDPIGRSLITRLIADRLIRESKLQIPNPTHVFRVLGSHRSTYPDEVIEHLVRSLSPREILEVHANHDRSGRFDLVISVLDGPSRTIQRTKTWSGLEFSDVKPPSVVVQGILGEIVELVSGKKARVVKKSPPASMQDLPFPKSLEELIAESAKSPLHSAAYLQLIGMLHPHGDFNEVRYGLFERSLVQLARLPDEYPGKRYFLARAYAYLGRRPAAIEALGEPKTSYELAFLALLNGDLPKLRNAVEKMETSPLDFMAWRELIWLESTYGDERERRIIDDFVEHAPIWAPFIDRALRDTSIRPVFTTAAVKFGLDLLLPNDVTTLQLIANRAAVTGEYPDELELTRLVWRHIDAVDLKEVAARAGRPESYLDVSELDIIDLGKASAVANQITRVEFDLSIKHLPDAALRKIAEFNVFLAGHPSVALQKARALDKLVREASGVELQTLRKQTATEFLNGLAWTGQMTKDAAEAALRYDASIRQLGLGRYSERGKAFVLNREDPIRYFEWPMSQAWFYVGWSGGVPEDILERCIAYTWTLFYCVKARAEQLEEDSPTKHLAGKELFATHEHRFVGNPRRKRFEIELARLSGNEDAEIRELRAQVEGGSTDWSAYYALGRALRRNGDFEAAQEVYLSYPRFKSRAPDDAIARSNHAELAGSMLYWIGRYHEAMPLLEIAASSGTGADSSFSAGNRLSLIVGDLEAAESWTAARVRRYGSNYAVRDLQQILHIQDKSDVAWSIFDHAMQSSRRQAAQLWSGALVGHRMASASTEDIVNWIDASELRKSASTSVSGDRGNIKLAPRYLLLAGTLDRLPGAELAEGMARFRFDRPPRYIRSERWPRSGPEGATVVPGFVQEDGRGLGWDELISTPRGLPDKKRHESVEPRYEKMARAMSALLGSDFEGAFDIFNEAARLYYLEEYLPYYALSASILGRAGHLRAAMEAREPALMEIRREEGNTASQLGFRFDEDLTYAVLAAFEGRHDESIHYLQQAMNNRPYLDNRTVFPYYQVIDLADRLFDRTGVQAYRDYALDMARRHTIVLPMYAWAYFIVAKYSESEAEQLDATASGLKLDPLSHRATQLPESLIVKARRHLEEHGAPYLRRTEQSLNLGT